jgi:hypothetical protein
LHGAALFVVALVVYGLTSYGGIRSPDSEVVFRTCEALATRGSLVVEPLEKDPGFGVAPGRDGRLYSVFGPLESLACATFYPFSRGPALAPEWVPPSHYAAEGIELMLDRKQTSSAVHRARFVVSFLTSVISAASVWVFFLLSRRLYESSVIAVILASLFGFATLQWPYSSTFFSEPLALLLMLLSLLLVIDLNSAGTSFRSRMVMAGLFLGLSATAHLSAVLFIPFFLFYAAMVGRSTDAPATVMRRGLPFAMGSAIPLLLLGVYNLVRFGSFLETGRGVVSDAVERFAYGSWIAPWEGLIGLLVSPGKGLLFFCPLVILGLVALPALFRQQRILGWTLVAVVGTRVLLIAARSDWHGGFGLGPRYLLLVVPLLLIPVGAWLQERPSATRLRVVLVAGVVAAVQQFYFVLGEIFSYYHGIWMFAEHEERLDLLQDIYFNWGFSPLVFLLKGQRGPWTLHGVEVSSSLLIVMFGFVTLVAAALCYRWALARLALKQPAR